MKRRRMKNESIGRERGKREEEKEGTEVWRKRKKQQEEEWEEVYTRRQFQ